MESNSTEISSISSIFCSESFYSCPHWHHLCNVYSFQIRYHFGGSGTPWFAECAGCYLNLGTYCTFGGGCTYHTQHIGGVPTILILNIFHHREREHTHSIRGVYLPYLYTQHIAPREREGTYSYLERCSPTILIHMDAAHLPSQIWPRHLLSPHSRPNQVPTNATGARVFWKPHSARIPSRLLGSFF